MNSDAEMKLDPDRCAEVVLAALWMSGNLSAWPATPDSVPCENCLDPKTLAYPFESGLVEPLPLVDFRPIRLTPVGPQRARAALQRVCGA